MNGQHSVVTDDKVEVRDALDLTGAEWRRAEPEGEHIPDAIELAFVPHTDGLTYVAMRQPSQPDGVVLIFTPSEWDAFVAGARDGEFDIPES
ncbi:MAG TPA: DUF397 domain-containing protein [Amycolatopsis sp.]|uniref:DUF397 domain-containing protein n=1 Tax=Amycolatopsis sp. TaxID=37632 RepID=UPI002B4873E9|nr:DUF397 domain-containing protein [Amycolatopsis sp.]HKS48228.1 DUF397 domain-containing protein [Amycolatopsis sp.]